ncbi:uncharacterized protein LOC133391210 [Anopheles gambiae]|uniref:uncharacterized protein LOC133391210 n=1 Tax=Anopheles gambiae TaxID=7165 RepID=UPI002AC96589|nr:uncharacterized protein LOC133391210 [Anopheles gambiae]
MGNLLCCRTKKRTKSTGSSSSFNSEYDSHQLPWDAEAFQWVDPSRPQHHLPTAGWRGGTAFGQGITTSQVKPPQVVASKSCPNRQPVKSCEACGETDHRADSCRYATRMCFYCRSEGHIMRNCQKRKRGRKVLHHHRIKAGGAYQVPTMELKNKYQPHHHHQPKKGHSAGQRKQPHRNGLTATGGRKKVPGHGWVAPNHHHQPPKPQQHHHLPPGVGRKPRTPIRTIVAFGSVEDLRNDDALKRDNGCGYLIYAIMCCI